MTNYLCKAFCLTGIVATPSYYNAFEQKVLCLNEVSKVCSEALSPLKHYTMQVWMHSYSTSRIIMWQCMFLLEVLLGLADSNMTPIKLWGSNHEPL